MIVDADVFIHFERHGTPIDLSAWSPLEDVFVSAITVSELLTGVHRADTEARRRRRSEFVEVILAGVGVLDFTAAVARRHAVVRAQLVQRGEMIGGHDLIIAATALHHGFPLLTRNVEEFRRVSGLNVVPFTVT